MLPIWLGLLATPHCLVWQVQAVPTKFIVCRGIVQAMEQIESWAGVTLHKKYKIMKTNYKGINGETR